VRKLIATALLVFGLLGCVTNETKQEQARFATEQFAWLEMCQLLIDEDAGYHCARLMPPLVVYEEMRDGLHGYYEGGDIIYINEKLSGNRLTDVLMHEGVHYVHVQIQMIEVPGPAIAVCWSENEAWTLTGLYWNEDNSRWWRAYPHCWEFYADTQQLREYGYVYNIITDIVDGIIWEN
jgi:hypothetical protein